MKKLFFLLFTILFITGCGSNKVNSNNEIDNISDVQKSDEIVDDVSQDSDLIQVSDDIIDFDSIDKSHFKIDFVIQNDRDLVFMPNYYSDIYGCEDEIDIVLKEWGELHFKDAEQKLLKIEKAIENSPKQYYPDDIVFVKEALGILYCDMAQYDKAYDYLVDAYVAIKDIYGENVAGSDSLFYIESMRLALCHYYYNVGDYESCIKEIQEMRDLYESTQSISPGLESCMLFLKVEIDNIEASIRKDYGDAQSALSLYMGNLDKCNAYIATSKDDTLGYMLKIKTAIYVGDWCSYYMKANPEWVNTGYETYEEALRLCDHFDGVLKEKFKCDILLKQVHLVAGQTSTEDIVAEKIQQAISIQEKLVEEAAYWDSVVDDYILCAEHYGFVLNDKETSVKYYERAEEIAREIYGEYHPKRVLLYESEGRYFVNKQAETEYAIECFLNCEEIYKNLLIEKSIKMAGIYVQLAGCYQVIGESELSKEYLEKSQAIYASYGMRIMTNDDAEK